MFSWSGGAFNSIIRRTVDTLGSLNSVSVCENAFGSQATVHLRFTILVWQHYRWILHFYQCRTALLEYISFVAKVADWRRAPTSAVCSPFFPSLGWLSASDQPESSAEPSPRPCGHRKETVMPFAMAISRMDMATFASVNIFCGCGGIVR